MIQRRYYLLLPLACMQTICLCAMLCTAHLPQIQNEQALLCTTGITLQEDDEFLDSQAASQSAGTYDALITAGLSSHLASSILDQQSSFLPWAVLLALLLELPPQSPRRLSISQALHNSHR